MKGPFARTFSLVVASTILVGFAVTVPLSGEAWAQKKKIVVESFKGPAAAKYRIAVMKSLYAAGFEVIPDRTLVKVEADLGLRSVSDSYSGIARELKLSGFVSGIITGGRRPKARVIVRNPDGKPIGGQVFQATSAPKLMAMVSAGSGAKAAAVLGGASGGGGGGPVAAAPEPKAEEAPVAAAEDEERPRKRRAAAEDDDKPAKEEDTEEPAGDDADAEVAAGADDDDEPAAKKKAGSGRNLRLAFVLRTFSRNFQYNQSKVGRNQGYQAPESKFNGLPLVPSPGLAVEFFPARVFGVNLAYNRAIIGSKDTQGSVYSTTAYTYQVGLKGRIPVSVLELEPGVAYAGSVFNIQNFKGDPTRIQVAPVDYRFVRAGSDVRIPMSGGTALSFGGHYLHVLSAGDILDVKKGYFGGTAVGGELSAGLVMPLSFAQGLDFGLGLDFRRIAFAFTPNRNAARIAGGAVDQYIGLNLGVGYNLGL